MAKLTASDATNSDYFGGSVAIDGDTIVIGANGDDDGGDISGSVYVFRTSDGWDTHTEIKLTASDAAAGDRFGLSVATDGDRYGRGLLQGRPNRSGLRFHAACSAEFPANGLACSIAPAESCAHHDADAAPHDGGAVAGADADADASPYDGGAVAGAHDGAADHASAVAGAGPRAHAAADDAGAAVADAPADAHPHPRAVASSDAGPGRFVGDARGRQPRRV